MRRFRTLPILAALAVPTFAFGQEERIRAALAAWPVSRELLPTLAADAQALLASGSRAPIAEALAHKALGCVALAERQYAVAEKHLTRALELHPYDGESSARLASVALAQKKGPNWRSIALFHYARAATYRGPGALPETARNGVMEFARKAFQTSFSTDEKAFQSLLAATATQALPPANFTISASAAAPAAPTPR